jgi:NAD(P)-dependent dehydrogenase (short-subunit alcohol dehydrogenase family)
MDLSGKSVVVTGAGAGIGRAIALAFAHKGAQISVLDINAANGQRTAMLCSEQGSDANCRSPRLWMLW